MFDSYEDMCIFVSTIEIVTSRNDQLRVYIFFLFLFVNLIQGRWVEMRERESEKYIRQVREKYFLFHLKESSFLRFVY